MASGCDKGGWGGGSHWHTWIFGLIWDWWQLYGDNVTMQWVPSHVGVQGNEQADEGAVRGFVRVFAAVV